MVMTSSPAEGTGDVALPVADPAPGNSCWDADDMLTADTVDEERLRARVEPGAYFMSPRRGADAW
jgi:hypothetical protein